MTGGFNREQALSRAFEFAYKSDTQGDYYEFGVYQGASLVRAMKADLAWQKRTGRAHLRRFFAFDSFEGLPPLEGPDRLASYDVFHEGQFGDTSVETVLAKLRSENLSSDNVEIFAGRFSDTLTRLEVLEKSNGRDVAVVHIDCDLYNSAVDCLSFLDGRLADGAMMLFDDWFCYRGRPDRGVRRAFEEWQGDKPYDVAEYFSYSWAGKAFIVTRRD